MTGGTGLVGRDIADLLRQEATVELTVVSRLAPTGSSVHQQWISFDLGAGEPLPLEYLDGVDILVHGAAQLRHADPADHIAAARLNFLATTEIFARAVDAGVRKIVYLSGLNFLRRPLAPLIDESHPVGPQAPYAMGKLWGELALQSAVAGTTTIPVCLRITSPVPEKAWQLHDTVLRRWIAAAHAGHPVVLFGQGGRQQDYVVTRDVARAVWLAIAGSKGGVFNIASGSTASNAEVARLIASRYDVPLEYHGVDPQEKDAWNVSIARARYALGYEPTLSSLDAIRTLITDSHPFARKQ